ncbi:TetR/AcrR family transcriptional regulator C-terminal domain-containing protein [Nonomuraea aurantiaca]|uniref:TetR/AcrR family transcriptional regulator C-terminal domain-containing protein n=1 Tax=Nonomuraea aurantiaca TaxID=2878562 RepID=UPI0035577C2C
MRRLAADVGVEAMSLYYHLPGKEALLDGVVETVVAEMHDAVGRLDTTKPDGDWRTRLRQRFLAAREVMLRHSWAPGLLGSRRTIPAGVVAYYDGIVGTLVGAGFSYHLAHRALHALGRHSRGERGCGAGSTPARAAGGGGLRRALAGPSPVRASAGPGPACRRPGPGAAAGPPGRCVVGGHRRLDRACAGSRRRGPAAARASPAASDARRAFPRRRSSLRPSRRSARRSSGRYQGTGCSELERRLRASADHPHRRAGRSRHRGAGHGRRSGAGNQAAGEPCACLGLSAGPGARALGRAASAQARAAGQ